ncbi:calcium-binding protein [Chelatococcus sp. GCM10030263]|uniref:calcium-binding protein n=1 Tax=Chelatococcus sp. GCM10030263 TaxID=3273387 RepID=UPI0036114C92
MFTRSFISDFLDTDPDLDWHGFLRGKVQAEIRSHSFGLDSLDPSLLTDLDTYPQDWTAALAGLHGVSGSLDNAVQSTPEADKQTSESSSITTADIQAAAADEPVFPTSRPPGTESESTNGDSGGEIASTGLNDYTNGMGGDDIIISIDTTNTGEDWISGGAGNDIILAGAGPDHVWGDDGNDNISGEGGNDIIVGGTGRDTIGGGGGEDTIYGGLGGDNLSGGNNSDFIIGGLGADTINGGDGSDTLWGDDSDVDGAAGGADSLIGGAGDDALYGALGNDTLQGGGGNDVLVGGGGNDRLVGGGGNDNLFGNNLLGVPEADTFVFASGWGNDRIYSYNDGMDKFDMRQVVGLLGFDQLTITQSGGDTIIALDNLGGVLGGGTITLQDVAASTIDATDFIFLV